MPRFLAPKRNDSSPSFRQGPSRRIAVGVTTMALVGVGLLSGCGNAVEKQSTDTRPEPNASTEGVRQVFPSAAPEGALPSASPLPGSGGDQANPRLDPPTNGTLPR